MYDPRARINNNIKKVVKLIIVFVDDNNDLHDCMGTTTLALSRVFVRSLRIYTWGILRILTVNGQL